MKLIDVLVRDLHKFGGWPEGAVECVRFVDEATIDFYDEHGNWPDDCSLIYGPIAKSICITPTEPCQRESVTLVEYEAALVDSKEMIINKPDFDGWISWCGGECPVDGDVVVDVKFRAQGQADLDGDVADNFRWEHFSNGADVVAYRLHKSEHQKPEWDGEGLPPVGCECEYETKFDGWQPVRIELIKSEGIAFTWLANSQAYNGLDCVGVQKSGSFRPTRPEAERKRDEAVKEFVRQIIECVDLHAMDKRNIDIVRERLYSMLPTLPGVTVID